MNSKIAMSGLSILASFAIMGGATFAFFSSSATSTGNVFAAGTMELMLDDNNQGNPTPVSTVDASITDQNLVPGGPAVSGFISLHNTGSVDMAEVVFGADIPSGNNGNGDGSDIASKINLTVKTHPTDNSCGVGSTDLTGTIATPVGDGLSPLTLRELADEDYNALPGITNGDSYFVCVTAALDESANNTYQGDSIDTTFEFTGNQNNT
jgi:predicted ribosomally synthesized peptide with SipW-like signal peptide